MIRRWFPTLIALLLLFSQADARAKESGNVWIEPDRIMVGLFYGGQNIHVRAELPAGYDVLIKLAGKNEELELKKKGKKGGVLWMNVGEVSYREVPSLFIIRSSHPLKNLAAGKVLNRLGIGYEALEAQVIAADDEDGRSLFDELIRLKEKEGLFSVDENGLEITSSGVRATIFLPPQARLGEYQVEVFGFKDGEGSLLGSGAIKLDFTPATAFISQMAQKHGLVYGCLAAAVAIIAGLAIGYIFGGKGEAH